MEKDVIDMLNERISRSTELLEQARIVALEARNLLNLPEYTDLHLLRIINEIDRIIGSGNSGTGGMLKTELRLIHETMLSNCVR